MNDAYDLNAVFFVEKRLRIITSSFSNTFVVSVFGQNRDSTPGCCSSRASGLGLPLEKSRAICRSLCCPCTQEGTGSTNSSRNLHTKPLQISWMKQDCQIHENEFCFSEARRWVHTRPSQRAQQTTRNRVKKTKLNKNPWERQEIGNKKSQHLVSCVIAELSRAGFGIKFA